MTTPLETGFILLCGVWLLVIIAMILWKFLNWVFPDKVPVTGMPAPAKPHGLNACPQTDDGGHIPGDYGHCIMCGEELPHLLPSRK